MRASDPNPIVFPLRFMMFPPGKCFFFQHRAMTCAKILPAVLGATIPGRLGARRPNPSFFSIAKINAPKVLRLDQSVMRDGVYWQSLWQ